MMNDFVSADYQQFSIPVILRLFVSETKQKMKDRTEKRLKRRDVYLNHISFFQANLIIYAFRFIWHKDPINSRC